MSFSMAYNDAPKYCANIVDRLNLKNTRSFLVEKSLLRYSRIS